MKEKKCPRCKESKSKDFWHKGGYAYSTYCKKCQRHYSSAKADKRNEKIMKATNNGKCWWLYQSIVSDTHFRTQIKKKKR